MARALISPENSLLRNIVGVAIASVVIPLAIVTKLIIWPFERPAKRSPAEVLGYLRDFHDGTGDDYDWDYFISVPLANPGLEQLRKEAAALHLPFGAEELTRLSALIKRAQIIADRPKPE